jgi:hypothetical protein
VHGGTLCRRLPRLSRSRVAARGALDDVPRRESPRPRLRDQEFQTVRRPPSEQAVRGLLREAPHMRAAPQLREPALEPVQSASRLFRARFEKETEPPTHQHPSRLPEETWLWASSRVAVKAGRIVGRWRRSKSGPPRRVACGWSTSRQGTNPVPQGRRRGSRPGSSTSPGRRCCGAEARRAEAERGRRAAAVGVSRWRLLGVGRGRGL